MSDLIGICGQVRGLMPKLLDKGQLDRMVGAKDAAEAFSVLTELQYADYFDDQTRVSDFDKVIDQGLFETKELLQTGGNDHPGLDFLWLFFDINNCKRALKQKLVEGASELQDFTNDKSFSQLGTLTASELQKIVFERKPAGSVPFQVLEAVLDAENQYNKTGVFRDIEFAIDNATFAHLYGQAHHSGDEFLQDWFEFLVDSTQLRNIARSALMFGAPLPDNAWLPFGHFGIEKAGKVETFEEVEKLARPTEFVKAFEGLGEATTDEAKLLKLEQNIDRMRRDFLSSRATGSIDSVAVLLDYFEQRLSNAQLIKLVMYAQMNGMSSEEIYKLVEQQ